jgi:hypothetical protein
MSRSGTGTDLAGFLRIVSFLPLSSSPEAHYLELMEIVIFFTTLTALAFAVNAWGADSRDSRDWHDQCDPWGTPGHHV